MEHRITLNRGDILEILQAHCRYVAGISQKDFDEHRFFFVSAEGELTVTYTHDIPLAAKDIEL